MVIALTLIEYLFGTAEIAAVFMAVVGGVIAISMFRSAGSQGKLRAWRFLIAALVLFAAEEVIGALRTFGVYRTVWLTHVVPSVIMMCIITALILQIEMENGGRI